MAGSLKRNLGRVSLRIGMKVGEIYWTRLASRGGREQAGRRPSIILQKDTKFADGFACSADHSTRRASFWRNGFDRTRFRK